MGAIASQITSLTIVYSTVYSGKKTSKLRVTGLCARNSSVTGEFLAQMASNAENVSIWWRHHGCCRSWPMATIDDDDDEIYDGAVDEPFASCMIVHFSAHISKWELVCGFGVIFHMFIVSCLCSRFHVRGQWFFCSVMAFSYIGCFVRSCAVDVVFALSYWCVHMNMSVLGIAHLKCTRPSTCCNAFIEYVTMLLCIFCLFLHLDQTEWYFHGSCQYRVNGNRPLVTSNSVIVLHFIYCSITCIFILICLDQ